MRNLTEVIIVGLAILGIAMLVQGVAGCSGAQKSMEAEASYLSMQLQCVDAFDTRPAIDACRAKVRKEWGIAESVTDAGKADR